MNLENLTGKNREPVEELSSDVILKIDKNGEIIDFFAGSSSELLSSGAFLDKTNIWSIGLFQGIKQKIEPLIEKSIKLNKLNAISLGVNENERRWNLNLFVIPYDKDKAMLFLKDTQDTGKAGALAHSEHIRLLARNLPCGFVIIFSSELVFTFVEGEGIACMGLNKDDIIGKSLPDLNGISVIPREVYIDALAGKVTNTRLERNGKWFHLTLFPLADDGKKAESAMIIGFDITYLMDDEQKMAHAMKALEEKNRQLEEFNFVSSHDLQEPLRMVTSFTQLLAKKYSGRLDDEAEQFIEFALEGAMRIKTIIRDLITYIRVDKNHVSNTRLEPLDAIELAKNELMLDILEKGADIQISTSMPEVYYDFGQLTEVFRNIISNSIKFNTSKPFITISAEEMPDEIIFCIQDNGIGIAREYHTVIFDLFQRLNAREKYAGNGLGLAIVKNIVERQGGRIYCESEPDKGSKFYFTILKKKHA